MSRQPMHTDKVLVLDDHPDTNPLAAEESIDVVHPIELTKERLATAAVVLVDYLIDDWESPSASETFVNMENLPLACMPSDGLALASIVQAHERREAREHQRHSPLAVALLSGELDLITPGFNSQEHMVALTYSLDWAFSKTPDPAHPPLSKRVFGLRDAICSLPEYWPDTEEELNRLIRELMGLDDVEWAAVAWSDLEASHPPIHQLARWTDGMVMMRWLLQRILPYPCFLLDERYLSARLGVSVDWTRTHLNSGLRDLLSPTQYTGVLSDFLGTHWWAAGLDDLLWPVEQAANDTTEPVAIWLEEQLGAKPELSARPKPVVCIGPDYRAIDEQHPMSECVRLQPDDWPVFAHDAWARVVDVQESPELSVQVIVADRDKFANGD